jgi:hypothetical protein
LLEKQIPFDRAASKKILTPMEFYVNFFKKISYLGLPGRASGEDGENPSRPGRCEWGSSSPEFIEGWEGARSRLIHKPENLPK